MNNHTSNHKGSGDEKKNKKMENELTQEFARMDRRDARNKTISNVLKYIGIPLAAIALGAGTYQSFKPRNFEGTLYSVVGSDNQGTRPALILENPKRSLDVNDSDLSKYRGQEGKRISGQYNYSLCNGLQPQILNSQIEGASN